MNSIPAYHDGVHVQSIIIVYVLVIPQSSRRKDSGFLSTLAQTCRRVAGHLGAAGHEGIESNLKEDVRVSAAQ